MSRSLYSNLTNLRETILVDEPSQRPVTNQSLTDCDCSDCACLLGDKFSPSSGLFLSSPVLYALELTPVCNNKCLGCANPFIPSIDKSARSNQSSLGYLTADGWRQVLDVIAPHASHLKLTGGEATLHPEFKAIVRDIDRRNISFALFTNGRWRNPEAVVEFLCIASNLTGLLVSLHGAVAETHEAFSAVRGSYVQAVSSIRLATSAGLQVALSVVLTRQNYAQIQDIVDLATRLEVDHVVFNRYLGPSLPEVEPSESQLAKAIEAIMRLDRDGARVKLGNCIPQCFYYDNPSTGCLAGIAYCAIDSLGNLRPCTHDSQICGNVLAQPIEQIWRGPSMDAWRNFIPNGCETCAALGICRSGCRATAQIRGGCDPLKRIPIRETPKRSVAPLLLYRNARPVGQFSSRLESFGTVLTQGNNIAIVPASMHSVLLACDSATTLEQIGEQFGDQAINLMGALYEQGVLNLLW